MLLRMTRLEDRFSRALADAESWLGVPAEPVARRLRGDLIEVRNLIAGEPAKLVSTEWLVSCDTRSSLRNLVETVVTSLLANIASFYYDQLDPTPPAEPDLDLIVALLNDAFLVPSDRSRPTLVWPVELATRDGMLAWLEHVRVDVDLATASRRHSLELVFTDDGELVVESRLLTFEGPRDWTGARVANGLSAVLVDIDITTQRRPWPARISPEQVWRNWADAAARLASSDDPEELRRELAALLAAL
jgi:hypothetical protein